MSAFREIFARFGIDFDSEPLEEGDSAVSGLVSRLQDLGQVIAGAAVVQGIRSFAAEMTDLGDELGDTSARLGISARELQEWRHVATLSGADAAGFTASLERMSRMIGEAGSGNRTAAAQFRALGVSIRNTDGTLRNASDVLTDLADPIAALPTQAQRTQVLMDLLGRSGAALGPLFERGSEGIREARRELERLGGGASDDMIEAAGALDDATVRMDVAFLSLKSRIAVFLLPAMERLAAGVTSISAGFSRLADRGRLLEATLATLGAVSVAAGARTVASWAEAATSIGGMAAVVIGAILIFEDLWVGLEGGESTLGDLGAAFERWAASATGAMEPVADVALAIRDAIAYATEGVVQAVHDFGRVSGLFETPTLARPTGQGPRVDPQQERAAAERVQALFAETTGGRHLRGARTDFGDVGNLLVGGRVGDLSRAVRTDGRGAPQVSQTVRIDRIDASGMTPEEAARAVETGVARALMSQADDTLDTMTQGG